jgi:thymidylate synthase|tara:strand:+ start:623 stop:1276 length:654 start_codon:yes stop_codon:yes gene_type:complete
MNKFLNANKAFHHLYARILKFGVDFDNTKTLFNVGFEIENPMDNYIKNSNYLKRNWKQDYAEAEWQWYLSSNRNIKKLGELYGKVPEIWKRMADKNGDVNSNYGWQWKRNSQLDEVICMLKENPKTRQAAISIYDAKEMHMYNSDTPCTYAVQFTILYDKLNMCVTMRSNDLWYGFCNDQYCFSRLQLLVSKKLNIEIGTYYHFAHNLHLYNNFINK